MKYKILNVLFLLSFLYIEKIMASEDKNISAYDFVFTSIEGNKLPLSNFSGKILLVVNTASFCGFTNQYAALQTLWDRYQKRGLIVLGVPSNDFGSQEPGTEEEIKDFCKSNFDINFPMTRKVHIKGPSAHPFYSWATSKLGAIAKPRWNFHKYLINDKGELIDWFSSPTSPLSNRLTRSVESLLPLMNDNQ